VSHAWTTSFKGSFDTLLKQIGVWAVYTRSDRRFRCTECFDRFNNDSRPDCSTCFGTGYRVTLERWLVFPTNALFRARPANVPQTPAGFDPNHPYFIFTRAKNKPAQGDRFFIVEWNQPRDLVVPRAAQPTRIVQALEVIYVDHEIAGELIYNVTNCLFRNEAIGQYETALFSTSISVSRP
jgi:hypothetical protein